MSLPTVCSACGNERDYPAHRGFRIDETKCSKCNGVRTLVRGGWRRPSVRARLTRARWNRCPDCGTATPCSEHNWKPNAVFGVCGRCDAPLHGPVELRHHGHCGGCGAAVYGTPVRCHYCGQSFEALAPELERAT